MRALKEFLAPVPARVPVFAIRAPGHDLNTPESPVPCAPFIPHTELGEQQNLTFKPRTHVRSRQPPGDRVGLAPRAPGSRDSSRLAGILGSWDAGDQSAETPASWTPPAQRYWAAELLISALSRKLFAPYKNKTPASAGSCRRSLRTTARLPPRDCGSASEILLLVSPMLQRGQRNWTATWREGSGGRRGLGKAVGGTGKDALKRRSRPQTAKG